MFKYNIRQGTWSLPSMHCQCPSRCLREWILLHLEFMPAPSSQSCPCFCSAASCQRSSGAPKTVRAPAQNPIWCSCRKRDLCTQPHPSTVALWAAWNPFGAHMKTSTEFHGSVEANQHLPQEVNVDALTSASCPSASSTSPCGRIALGGSQGLSGALKGSQRITWILSF